MKSGIATLGFLILSGFSNLFGQFNSFTDTRDGQVYSTFFAGGVEWFAENLRHETPQSFYYDNGGYSERYGRLYPLNEAEKACPDGWRLPSDQDWKDLLIAAGGYHDVAASGLIGDHKRAYHNLMLNGPETFGARLGGGISDEIFHGIHVEGNYWAGNPGKNGPVYYRLVSDRESVQRLKAGSAYNAYSCRCVRKNQTLEVRSINPESFNTSRPDFPEKGLY